MRVLHVAADTESGSGRGSYQLHQQLLMLGTDSCYFAAKSNDHYKTMSMGRRNKFLSKALPQLERFLARQNNADNTRVLFSISPGWLHTDMSVVIDKVKPDLVHLHWVWNGMISPAYAREISRQVPLVWTLRDMRLLTGGCHYPGQCARWLESCGMCPLLKSSDPRDISYRQHNEIRNSLAGSNVTLLATSSRMRTFSAASQLADLVHPEAIPISIDLEQFCLRDKDYCRKALQLEVDRKYLLFSALYFTQDSRKGWPLLQDLCLQLGKKRDWHLILVGDDNPALKSLPGVVSFGRLTDALSLSLIYSAADATIMPSEEESFGKVAAESLASGRPVIISSEAGAIDFIDHGKTGWIFPPAAPLAALEGIEHFFKMNESEMAATAQRCVAAACAFGEAAAKAHLLVYEQVISKFRGSA